MEKREIRRKGVSSKGVKTNVLNLESEVAQLRAVVEELTRRVEVLENARGVDGHREIHTPPACGHLSYLRGGVKLPDARNVDVWEYLQRAVKANYLKDNYSLNCSLTEASVLAWIVGKKVYGRPHWKWFEKLWGVRYLSSYYSKAIYLEKFYDLEKDLNKTLNTHIFSK